MRAMSASSSSAGARGRGAGQPIPATGQTSTVPPSTGTIAPVAFVCSMQ